MTPNAVELRPRTVGEVLGLTLSLYRKNFPLFLGITALVAVPGLILASLSGLIPALQLALAPDAFFDPSGGATSLGGTLAALSAGASCLSILAVLYGVFWPLMEGAFTHNVIERMVGRAPGLGASYAEARSRWGALWVSNILAQIGIFAALFVAYTLFVLGLALTGVFGMVDGGETAAGSAVVISLLCLPVLLAAAALAVILAINWVFRAPAVMGEGADGIQALSRSTAIARGDRWRIFGRYLLLALLEFAILVLPTMLVAGVITVGAFLTPGRTPEEALRAFVPTLVGGTVLALALSFVGTLLLLPLRMIYTVVNYFDLRIRKENLATALRSMPVAPAAEAAEVMPHAVAPQAVAPTIAAAAATATTIVLPPQPAAPAPAAPAAAPADLAKLSPGQRVGVLFSRVRAEGESPQLLNDLGMAYADVGDLGGALDALTRARTLAPNDADIAYNLAVVHLNRKDDGAARAMLQEYLRLETNPEDAASVRANPRFQRLLS